MARIKLHNVSVNYVVASHSLKQLMLLKRHEQKKLIPALKSISLELNSGDMVGVVGPNGSGKTTLLKLLSGILPPTRGSLEVQGAVLHILKKGAGIIHGATLRENAMLKGTLHGLKGNQLDDFIAKVIRRSILEEKQDLPFNTLSQGMKAQYVFALNSIITKEILLLDEWIGTADEIKMKNDGIFSSLTNNAEILVLCSHNNKIIKNHCNRFLVLYDGYLEYDGNELDEAYSVLNRSNQNQH